MKPASTASEGATRTPIDQHQRQLATTTIAQNIVLEAGAGAGKTSVLVQRVFEVLESGVPASRVAAITFTERAAGELQVRLRDELERRWGLADDHQKLRLEAFIASLPELHSSTIHAFCKHLLEEEALEAAWAPDTRLFNHKLDGGVFEEAFSTWRFAFRQGQPELDNQLRELAHDGQLRHAARTLFDERDLRPSLCLDPPDWVQAMHELERLAQPLQRHFAHSCLHPKSCELYQQLIPFIDWLSALQQPQQLGTMLDSMPPFNLRRGRAGDWRPGACAQVKALEKELRQWQESWQRARTIPLHGALVDALWRDLIPSLEKQRRAKGLADFSDLLQRTRWLLEHKPAARARLAAAFDAILIDEVQDTDPIQSRIALLLSRPVDAQGPWNAHPPEPGKLFAVGDPKQSIYRFRRADVATWAALREQVSAADGLSLRLEQNFRSVPGLVAWCNHSFQTMPGYEPQLAARSDDTLAPVVELRTEDDDFDALARYLWALRNAEPLLQADTQRPSQDSQLRWSEVMVLLPSWSHADELQSVLLAAKIPCLVEGGRAFAKRDEIRLCLAALRAINEPSDSEAIVFVLRGLFGLSHEDLARHLHDGGAWRYTIKPRPATRAAEALELLDGLHRKRGHSSWVVLLDALLAETQAPAVWALTPRGSAAIANLDKLRVLIRQLETETNSPDELISLLLQVLKNEDQDLPLGDLDSDAVRITTYFGAKGREARVVALLAAHRKKQGIRHVIDRAREELALRIGELIPKQWQELEEQEKRADDEERRRWMYVAATRAQDQLLLVHHPRRCSLFHPDVLSGLPKGGSHGDTITAADGVHVRILEHDALPPVSYTRSAFPGLQANIDALLAQPPAPIIAPGSDDSRSVRKAQRACTRWQSVSERIKAAPLGSSSLSAPLTRDPEGLSKDGGVLVHRVLERLDLSAARAQLRSDATATLEKLASQRGLSEDFVERCEKVLLQILEHPVFEQARSAPEVWQETPFSMRIGNSVVSGSIDLCFPLDEGRSHWVIVDYKSRLPRPGSAAAARYQQQLEHYAKALLSLIEPCTQVSTVLVGPHPELPRYEDALLYLQPELLPGVMELMEAGLPEPVVGYEPELDAAPMLELAWPELHYGVLLDPPPDEAALLAANGWTVEVAMTQKDAWVEQVLDSLRRRFPSALNPASDDAWTEPQQDAHPLENQEE